MKLIAAIFLFQFIFIYFFSIEEVNGATMKNKNITQTKKNLKMTCSESASMILSAVSKKDFTTFKTFFDSSLGFFAVLPGGRIFDTVEDFMESQVGWFEKKGGLFEYEIRHVEESKNLGMAHIIVNYRDVDEKVNPFHMKIYITFTLKKNNGSWYLVHDQNTVLSKE